MFGKQNTSFDNTNKTKVRLHSATLQHLCSTKPDMCSGSHGQLVTDQDIMHIPGMDSKVT